MFCVEFLPQFMSVFSQFYSIFGEMGWVVFCPFLCLSHLEAVLFIVIFNLTVEVKVGGESFK